MTVADDREAARAVAAQPADVRLVDVTKRFDDVVAVDNLSLEIERGRWAPPSEEVGRAAPAKAVPDQCFLDLGSNLASGRS